MATLAALAAPPRVVQLPGQVVGVPGQPVAPVASPLPSEEQALAEREQRRLMLEQINRNNPMAHPSGIPMETEPTQQLEVPQLTPEQIEQIRKLQALLDQPSVKKYISVVSDPQLSAEVQLLLKSDRLKHAGIAQLVWIFVYFGLKGMLSQRLRDEKILRRAAARFGLFCIFVFVASIALPALILGSPYLRILSRVYAVLFSG